VEAIVAGGKAGIGLDQLQTVVDAVKKGTDFVVFAATYQKSPAGLMSLPRNPIRTASDIVGKRIGVQQGGKEFVDAVLKVNGLRVNYKEVPVGFDPQPLVEGACDGYVCFVTNQPLVLAQKGIAYIAVTWADMGLPTYSDVLFSSRDYVNKNQDVVTRFLRATIKGWEMNTKDPSIAPKLVANKYGADLGLNVDQQRAQNLAQIPLTQSELTKQKGMMWISTGEISGPIYKAFAATGRTDLPPVDRLVDLSILKDAFGGKTSLL
jgi:ABC-type nitrate/sulfonate/bicarbonate transport system substrate-binding protein